MTLNYRLPIEDLRVPDDVKLFSAHCAALEQRLSSTIALDHRSITDVRALRGVSVRGAKMSAMALRKETAHLRLMSMQRSAMTINYLTTHACAIVRDDLKLYYQLIVRNYIKL